MFNEDQLKLNLQKNEEGLYASRRRIQGSYPIYLPPHTLLTERIVQVKFLDQQRPQLHRQHHVRLESLTQRKRSSTGRRTLFQVPQ